MWQFLGLPLVPITHVSIWNKRKGKKWCFSSLVQFPNPTFCDMALILLKITIIIKRDSHLSLTVFGAWLQPVLNFIEIL